MGAIDLEDAGHGLLLEPLARVARIGPGSAGELFRVGRALVGKRSVPAQPITEVDGREVEGRVRGREDALGERL